MTLEVMDAAGRQKHHSETKNVVMELIYQKKYLMKVSKQPQKPLSEFQSDLSYGFRVESYDV